MIPDFKQTIQKHVSPDKVGEYLANIMNSAVEKGTTDDQIKALDTVLNLAYSEEVGSMRSDVPLIGQNNMNGIAPYIENKQLPIMPSEVRIMKEVTPLKETITPVKKESELDMLDSIEDDFISSSDFINEFEKI
jgi:hypothetical protein